MKFAFLRFPPPPVTALLLALGFLTLPGANPAALPAGLCLLVAFLLLRRQA